MTVIENKELLQRIDVKTAEMFGNPDMYLELLQKLDIPEDHVPSIFEFN